jgi:hypothetical protein
MVSTWKWEKKLQHFFNKKFGALVGLKYTKYGFSK